MKIFSVLFIILLIVQTGYSQEIERWDKQAKASHNPNLNWFENAKFGLFIHWGLYSKLGGIWKGRDFYGSGEWIMNRAKIPASEYAKIAERFNPFNFNADQWVKIAKDAGMKYLVITAKHHEGFAMFNSKTSDFNIVKATPFAKDPMSALASAARKAGLKFGFYYSQYLDWHEPDGGGNNWDFDKTKKDYLKYYKEKAIPQLKELLTGYGPLGIMWFDMPGGLNKAQTENLVDSLHKLQPDCLFSSRVGHDLGDYRDFGDSEIPAYPIKGAWESIYTHNDSWGYIKYDMDFKSPREIIRLLAKVASKGGNLLLNVGPDGTGKFPHYSEKYLLETGKWLKRNGESIYGTTYGLIPPQPWGVTTSKPGKLFLHIFRLPYDRKILVPNFTASVKRVFILGNNKILKSEKNGSDLYVSLNELYDRRNTVLEVDYTGKLKDLYGKCPLTVSPQFESNVLDASYAHISGGTKLKSITYSHYFGDWKHTTCAVNMKDSSDIAKFNLRFTHAGDYKIITEYSCPDTCSGQEAAIELNNGSYRFETLATSDYNSHRPLLFIKHPVADVSIEKAGEYVLKIHPLINGKELFFLKSIIIKPID